MEKNVNRSAFCNDICMETCAIHGLLTHTKQVHQVFLAKNELDCFRVFQHKVLTNVHFKPFIANENTFLV